jgi:hypothetical protein
MSQINKDRPEPTWILWRCQAGSQWTSVKDGLCNDGQQDGKQCPFSGCNPIPHTAHIVGGTVNRDVAHKWFIRWDEDPEEDEL